MSDDTQLAVGSAAEAAPPPSLEGVKVGPWHTSASGALCRIALNSDSEDPAVAVRWGVDGWDIYAPAASAISPLASGIGGKRSCDVRLLELGVVLL